MTPEQEKIKAEGGVPAGSLVIYTNRVPSGVVPNRRTITLRDDMINASHVEVIRWGPANDHEGESIEPKTDVNEHDTRGIDEGDASVLREDTQTDPQQDEDGGTAADQLAEMKEQAGEATVDAFNSHDPLTKTCFYCYKARSGCDGKTRRPCSRCQRESRTAADCVNHDEHPGYAGAKRDNRLKELKDFNKWPLQQPK